MSVLISPIRYGMRLSLAATGIWFQGCTLFTVLVQGSRSGLDLRHEVTYESARAWAWISLTRINKRTT